MTIQEYKKIAAVGDVIRTNLSDASELIYNDSMEYIDGYVGEIKGEKFYIWHNDSHKNGGVGNIPPSTKGFPYSWCINFCNTHEGGYIKVLNNKNKSMENLVMRFKNLSLSEPEKTFREVGITSEDGMLTNDGENIFLSFLLSKYGDEFKREVVDRLKENQ